jgi:hypothetical protein
MPPKVVWMHCRERERSQEYGIGVEVLVGDAARSGMDALPREGDVAGTKAREVKAERSSAEEAPTKEEDDPWPKQPTEEDEDKRPPW